MNEDKVLQKLIDHDKRLDNIEESMADKADIKQIMTSLDHITTTVDRLDSERLVSRQELDSQKKDIAGLKEHVGMA